MQCFSKKFTTIVKEERISWGVVDAAAYKKIEKLEEYENENKELKKKNDILNNQLNKIINEIKKDKKK